MSLVVVPFFWLVQSYLARNGFQYVAGKYLIQGPGEFCAQSQTAVAGVGAGSLAVPAIIAQHFSAG